MERDDYALTGYVEQGNGQAVYVLKDSKKHDTTVWPNDDLDSGCSTGWEIE